MKTVLRILLIPVLFLVTGACAIFNFLMEMPTLGSVLLAMAVGYAIVAIPHITIPAFAILGIALTILSTLYDK